ncbi:MAG: RidA family protein [Azospirillaceae bacterium]
MSTVHRILQPQGWAPPKGYSNGIEATGRMVFVGGQVGWDADKRFVGPGFVEQARQAMANIIAVLKEAGAGPEHIARLTWYVVDIDEYDACQRDLGRAYVEVLGKHFPAMSLIQVVRLAEPEARVEIEATAVL